MPSTDSVSSLDEVLESAARLQKLVPDAVLGDSTDHDHVVTDLRERFDAVLDAVESEGEWVTNRVVPGKIILGNLGEIEVGVRELIRKRPLEVQTVVLPDGQSLRVPTIEEALRIKAFLAIRRNQTRDYLDIAALSDTIGTDNAAAVLSSIDDYYADHQRGDEAVASQVVRQLARPKPKDSTVTKKLHGYKNLSPRWQDWSKVTGQCQAVARSMVLAKQEGI